MVVELQERGVGTVNESESHDLTYNRWSALRFSKAIPPQSLQGAGTRTGSVNLWTLQQVEQSQAALTMPELRGRMRSGSPRAVTMSALFM